MKNLTIFLTSAALAFGSATPALSNETDDALDRFEISEVMYQYSWAHNTTNPEEFADLFTGDGVFTDTGAQNEVRGRAALIAMTERDRVRFNPGAADGSRSFMLMRTFVTNPSVTLTGSNEANGNCYFQIIADKPGVGPQILAIGRYEDQFRRENGEWKIARRVIYMDMANMALAREIGVIE